VSSIIVLTAQNEGGKRIKDTTLSRNTYYMLKDRHDRPAMRVHALLPTAEPAGYPNKISKIGPVKKEIISPKASVSVLPFAHKYYI
jgi:hypothetical protein